MNIIEGAYLGDILDQPRALQRSLAGFSETSELRAFGRGMASGEYSRVVLTGMGSSLHALNPFHLWLTRAGLASFLIETAELIHYVPDILNERSLVIGVSQSGQSAEMLRLLDIARGKAPLIGVTNNPESPLALRSDACVLMQAGTESSVSCKTYVASLLALEWLQSVLSAEDTAAVATSLSAAAPAAAEYLTPWRQHVADLIELLGGVRQIFVTGRGPSLSTAGTGGLILKESARFPAEGMSCPAFRHGPFEMLSREVFVVVIAGDSRSAALNHHDEQADAAEPRLRHVIDSDTIGPFCVPRLPDRLRPILEILPIQMISLALAALNGHEAGRFELASKITSVE